MIRTQDEIVARIKARQASDMFGFEWMEYAAYLDFEHAKPFLKEGTKPEEWTQKPLIWEAIVQEMRGYLEFAFEKANNKRGISANRTIMHYIAWAWLAGEDELAAWIEREFAENYEFYGKPILRHIAEELGVDWKPLDNGELVNR